MVGTKYCSLSGKSAAGEENGMAGAAETGV
jgi:hypothetical protein